MKVGAFVIFHEDTQKKNGNERTNLQESFAYHTVWDSTGFTVCGAVWRFHIPPGETESVDFDIQFIKSNQFSKHKMERLITITIPP